LLEGKGHCEHGEFDLRTGCPTCTAARREEASVNSPENIAKRIAAVQPEQAEMETGLNSEGLTLVEVEETAVALRPFEDYEAHDCFLESERVLEIAKSRVITTLEESQAANADLALISKLTKQMDNKRKTLLAPSKEEADAIRDTYKYLMGPIIEANSITKNKMLAFDTKQRQIQAEQERINQQRLAAAQAEMNLKGELSESVNLVEVEKAPERVKTDMGTSFKTDRWKYKIDDINQLPKEYMLPDDAQLSAIARKHHDKKPVPGVTFYNDPYYTVRTK